MTRQCVLHVGAHKTGTSALQRLLFEMRGILRQEGWAYPENCLWKHDKSHNGLGIYFWPGFCDADKKIPFNEVIEGLLRESNLQDNLIISSELLEKTALKSPEILQSFLASIYKRYSVIRVIYVIRRQDRIMDSIFKQHVSGSETRFKGDPRVLAKNEAEDLVYSKYIYRWRSMPEVSEVVTIPYIEDDRTAVYREIVNRIGLPKELSAAPRSLRETENRSLNGFFLRYKHYLNRFVVKHDIDDRIVEAMRVWMDKYNISGSTTIFDDAYRHEFLKLFDLDWKYISSSSGIDMRRIGSLTENSDRRSEVFEELRENEIQIGIRRLREFDWSTARIVETIINSSPLRTD